MEVFVLGQGLRIARVESRGDLVDQEQLRSRREDSRRGETLCWALSGRSVVRSAGAVRQVKGETVGAFGSGCGYAMAVSWELEGVGSFDAECTERTLFRVWRATWEKTDDASSVEGAAVPGGHLVHSDRLTSRQDDLGERPPGARSWAWAFLRPRSVAIVGASANPEALAGKPVRYLLRHGYPGRILPVNPRHATLFGLTCYPSLSQVPGPVDLVIVAVRASLAAEVLAEAGALGVRQAIVIGSGFSETGVAGAAMEERLKAAARASGVRFLGPNTQGFVNVADHVAAAFSEALEWPPERMKVGRLALVSQSGAFGFSAFAMAQARGLGVRYMVATGNEADLTVADWIDAFLEDPEVGMVGVYMEGVRDPESLYEKVAHAARRGVPVALIRGGKSAAGARAARRHTGAPRTSSAFYGSLSRDLGVFLAEDLDEMFDLARLVDGTMQSTASGSSEEGSSPGPGKPGVGIVSISGGAAVLAADALTDLGIRIPPYAPATQRILSGLIPSYGSTRNPTDVTAQVLENVERFGEILRAVLDDPNVNALLVVATMVTGERGRRTLEAVVWALRRASLGRRALPCVMAYTTPVLLAPEAHALGAQAGLSVYETPRRAARALGAFLRARGAAGAKEGAGAPFVELPPNRYV